MSSLKSCKLKKWMPVFWSAVMLLTACTGSDEQSLNSQHKTWKDFGGNPDQSKYIALDEINKSNVDQLKVAWIYPTGDDKAYQFNPIIVDTVMYVLAKNNSLVALNAKTGKEIWIHANLQGIARRGINYWESKDRKNRRLIFQMNNYLQAIDASTGKSITAFGKNGLVDLRQGLERDPEVLSRIQSGSPGIIFENLLLLGSATGEGYMSTPGYLRAFDVVSGKIVWTFHTIPLPGEFGYDTWPKDAYKYMGGVNSWGDFSIDTERGIAYFPLGSPTYDYYGGDRIGSNLFGNCLLALDARTGKRLWHFQLVHHDLWDYDLSAAPQLVTVNHDGKKIDAVAIAGKNGFMFAFNRVTGEPLWPIEEHPVPASDIPGEQAWPTQPFPTVLPPFGRQGMTSADITPFFLTKEERAEWKKKIDSMQTGFYLPPSRLKPTLALPGAVGGASWGSTAANPEKGMVYVRSIDWPSFYGKMVKRDKPEKGELASAAERPLLSGQKVYLQNCQACHGADRAGVVGPSLLDLGSRVKFVEFQQIVMAGKGEMPSFHQLDKTTLKGLYQYLSGAKGIEDAKPVMPEGPVVASGGIPKGQDLRKVVGQTRFGPDDFGVPYPEGLNVPAERWFIPPGWGLEYPYLISPPWSSISAYDLNTGRIKWQIPIGEDLKAAAEGGKNTGVPRAQRNGMIVTSTGLLFSTSKDGKIYAYDADNGKVLWTGELPTGTEGLPSMYELNGRQYIVVCATTPIQWSVDTDKNKKKKETPPQGGYVVFALPK